MDNPTEGPIPCNCPNACKAEYEWVDMEQMLWGSGVTDESGRPYTGNNRTYCNGLVSRISTKPLISNCTSKEAAATFLEAHPTLCMKIKEYATVNLDTLSIEMLSQFIHDKILPKLLQDNDNEDDEGNNEKVEILDYENRIKD